MIYLTELQMRDGTGHQHIAAVRRRNPKQGKCGSSTVAQIVDWLQDKGKQAYVRHGVRDVRVGVV